MNKSPAKIILAAAALLIVAYCLLFLALTFATGDPIPMPFGFGTAVVLTGSMEPALSPNDLIFIVKSASYVTGDTVVYTTGGTPVVHRIIEEYPESGYVITKGDANNVDDGQIPLSRIKGKVVFAIPFIGFIPRFVRTVPGMIIVVVLIFTLFYLSVKSRTREEAEEEKYRRLREEIERLKAETGEPSEETGEAPSEPAEEKRD